MIKRTICKIKGHDLEAESITREISGDCWCRRCKRCGRYVLHCPIGSICMSEKEALQFIEDFDKELEHLLSNLNKKEAGGTDGNL